MITLIVIPTNGKKGLEDEVAQHFGRCNTYTFLDLNGNLIKIINNTSEHMGGKGLPPELMKKNGATILLCKSLGPRALDLCKNLGIDVFVYETKTVKEIFDAWSNNKIKKANKNDVCESHKD